MESRRIIRQRIEFLSNRNLRIIWNRAARLRMRRWLSSTSRCGLYVFRWPTYTDIYWLVLTFLSCNFAEPRMVRKRSIDPASNFHREGGGGGGLYWKTRPLCRRSPSFPNFLLDSLLCPTINPFLSSFFFFFFFCFFTSWTRFLFFEIRKGWTRWSIGIGLSTVLYFSLFASISEIKNGLENGCITSEKVS